MNQASLNRKALVTFTLLFALGLPVLGDTKSFATEATAGDRYEDALKKGTPILTVYSSPWDTRKNGGENCTPAPSHAIMGSEWTFTRFNTDSDYGGCEFYFYIRDTPGDIELTPGTLVVEFNHAPGAAPSECRNTGRREVIIFPGRERPSGTPFILDTDGTPPGCELTFRIENSNDIGLDIKFYADDSAGIEQCQNRTEPGLFHTARLNNPVKLGLHVDNRLGGCQLELRLRKL